MFKKKYKCLNNHNCAYFLCAHRGNHCIKIRTTRGDEQKPPSKLKTHGSAMRLTFNSRPVEPPPLESKVATMKSIFCDVSTAPSILSSIDREDSSTAGWASMISSIASELTTTFPT